MSQPLLVMAAGGTGGHMFPAQSLAEAMLERGWRVKLSTDARGARYTGAFPEAVQISEVSSATFSRGGILEKAAVPFRVLSGVMQARSEMAQDKPAVVVGFGGYPSIPALGAAWTKGLPRMVHEQNGVLGRVNQLFARRVDAVACGTWPTELPEGVSGEDVGNPIRSAVRAVAASPYALPSEGPLNLLVFGGSQGASVMRVVPKAVAELPADLRARLRVSQQARDSDAAEVGQAYADLGIAADIQPFFGDMPQRLVDAHLVIARSGASSVADIAAVGRPSIFVPLAIAVRDEQTANARGLSDAGAAQVIQERDLTPTHLAQQMTAILGDASKASQMAQAATDTGKPNAVEALVALVEKLARKEAP